MLSASSAPACRACGARGRSRCGPGACRRGPRFQVTHGLCHDLTGAVGQIIASAKTYVNMFEGPVTGNIPEVLDNGKVTDGTHVTAGQLALALTPYAQATDLAVNTAASGNNAAAIQSLVASKLDSSAQAAARGSSVAALPDHGCWPRWRPTTASRRWCAP